MKEKLVVAVLDFDKGIVYIYNDYKSIIDIEDFLIEKRHRINNCQWMVTKNKIIKL